MATESDLPQPDLHSPPRAYVNFAGGQGSLSELALTLGYREGDAHPVVVAPLVMTWEFVPQLITLLQEQLDSYQEQVGPVRKLEKREGKGEAK